MLPTVYQEPIGRIMFKQLEGDETRPAIVNLDAVKIKFLLWISYSWLQHYDLETNNSESWSMKGYWLFMDLVLSLDN